MAAMATPAGADLATDDTSLGPARTPTRDAASTTTSTVNRPTSGATNDASRSVELLLQLQDRPDLTNATARKSAGAVGTGGPAAPRAQDSTPVGGTSDAAHAAIQRLKTSVFQDSSQSTGTAPARVSNTANGDQPNVGTTRQLPAANLGPGAESSGEPVLSNPVVRFVRDNRTAVLAVCGAMLGLFGLATVLSGRRR